METGIRPVAPHELTAAAGVVAAAFIAEDEGLLRYIFVEQAADFDRVAALFTLSLRQAAAVGEVWVTGNPVAGVAAWYPPQPRWELSSVKPWELIEVLGAEAFRRHDVAARAYQSAREEATPADCWHLAVLAVAAGARGQGLGEALLRPTLDAASRGGLPCLVETTLPANRSYYARFGFADAVEWTAPAYPGGEALRFWVMVRSED